MEMGEQGGDAPSVMKNHFGILYLEIFICHSGSLTSEYSGPGSIQMENTYIPCLLDGWGAVVSNTEQNEGPSSSLGVWPFGNAVLSDVACFLGMGV